MGKIKIINDVTKDDILNILNNQYNKNECVSCFDKMTADDFGSYLERVANLTKNDKEK